MDFEALKREMVYPNARYVMVRPGITLRLTYPTPIHALGAAIADILEMYMAFIKPEVLNTYLAGDGTWKKLTPRILNRDLNELRTLARRDEFVEYHYGHGIPSNVGDYGVHFVGSHLGAERPPEEENLLLLEFPHDFLAQRSVDAFMDFIVQVAERFPFGSGIAGYAFKQLLMTFRSEAYNAIGELAPRYIGFDMNSDMARRHSRGRVYNVSWLTLLGSELVENLGGRAGIRGKLPELIKMLPLKTGLILKAGDQPIVGDVNCGAEDAAPLRALAQLTRGRRIAAEYLGPEADDFAESWLARFES